VIRQCDMLQSVRVEQTRSGKHRMPTPNTFRDVRHQISRSVIEPSVRHIKVHADIRRRSPFYDRMALAQVTRLNPAFDSKPVAQSHIHGARRGHEYRSRGAVEIERLPHFSSAVADATAH